MALRRPTPVQNDDLASLPLSEAIQYLIGRGLPSNQRLRAETIADIFGVPARVVLVWASGDESGYDRQLYGFALRQAIETTQFLRSLGLDSVDDAVHMLTGLIKDRSEDGMLSLADRLQRHKETWRGNRKVRLAG